MIITGKKFSKPDLSRVINGDTILNTTPSTPAKYRLDHLLVQQHPEYNRSSLQTFIKSGYVTVDDQTITKPNTKLDQAAQITLTVPDAPQLPPRPPVIYEDENVLVLNKPSGLLSIAKGEYCPEPTLEDYGLLVHRLDRDTSGVVILAKNPATQKMLRKQFQDRKAHKAYYAIVVGQPKLSEAMIDLPIARNLKRPTTFQVDQNGKPSQTYYKVLVSNEKYSLLELKPTTGRTHQLRVHLKYLGIPILGDAVYGEGTNKSRDQTKSEQEIDRASDQPPEIPRLFLHAGALEIPIPGPNGGERRTFSAPLPPEFNQIIQAK